MADTVKDYVPAVGTKLVTKGPVADVIDRLDSIGFDVGHTHISVWGGIVTLGVIVAMIALGRGANALANRVFRNISRFDRAQQLLGEKLASIVIWTIAFLIGIDMLGINLTALTVFSGAFGLAVGFGLQKTFGNLIAGIILLMDRSIKPGDVIAVNDGKGTSFGQVMKIGIRAVTVSTRDRREYLIPNEILMTSQVENWSYSSRTVCVSIPVGIAYDSDTELAERLMIEAASAAPRVLAEPAPGVLLANFGASSLDYTLAVWIDDPEDGLANVRSQILKRLLALFREHGIEIPYPQQDVRVRSLPAAGADGASGSASGAAPPGPPSRS